MVPALLRAVQRPDNPCHLTKMIDVLSLRLGEGEGHWSRMEACIVICMGEMRRGGEKTTCPVCSEVMRDSDDGVEILSTEDLDPNSLQRVVEMRQVAFESWWAPEHPGWGIYDEAPPDGIANCLLCLSLASTANGVNSVQYISPFR